MIIAISGLDGAGKSSAIHEIIVNLESKGIEAAYSWGGWKQFEILPFPRLGQIVRKKILGKQSLTNLTQMRNDSNKKIKIIISRCIKGFALIDFIIISILTHKKMAKQSAILFLDRYIADFIVGIASGQDFSKFDLSLMKTLDGILAQADIEFLIDVPPEIALSRKEDVNSLEELNRKRGLYLKIAKIRKMEIIDGRLPISVVCFEMRKKFNKLLV